MAETIKYVTEIPGKPPCRNHSRIAMAARNRPGVYVEVPWPDDKAGSLAQHYRKTYKLEAHTRNFNGERRVYVRVPVED
jgi:hypothetical protein